MIEIHGTSSEARRKEMEAGCKHLADRILAELPAPVGFSLFLWTGGIDGDMAWISNGDRKDMIAAMLEWLGQVVPREMTREEFAEMLQTTILARYGRSG